MTEILSLILGAVMPPIIDLLTKKVADSKVRFGISMAVCVVIGLAINYKTFTLENILGSLALVFTSAQTIYHTYWKDAGLRAAENKGK